MTLLMLLPSGRAMFGSVSVFVVDITLVDVCLYLWILWGLAR